MTESDISERIAAAGGRPPPAGLVERLTGVRERRYAPTGTASSDLAAAAALDACERHGLEPDSVDTLVFAAVTHDVFEPATAYIVQEKIGCRSAAVFDVKNACNGVMQALDLADAMISTRRARRVMIATGEPLSQGIDFALGHDDLASKFAALTLGDAGGSIVVDAYEGDDGRGLYPGAFYSDGRHWRLATVLAGGTQHWWDQPEHRYFVCDSPAIFELGFEHVPKVMAQALDHAGWSVDDIDVIVPHQVASIVVDRICSDFGIPVERCMVTFDRYGNCAAANIPLALEEADRHGYLHPGARVLLVGAASGFGCGALPVVW